MSEQSSGKPMETSKPAKHDPFFITHCASQVGKPMTEAPRLLMDDMRRLRDVFAAAHNTEYSEQDQRILMWLDAALAAADELPV
jgi:hypothetical protein